MYLYFLYSHIYDRTLNHFQTILCSISSNIIFAHIYLAYLKHPIVFLPFPLFPFSIILTSLHSPSTSFPYHRSYFGTLLSWPHSNRRPFLGNPSAEYLVFPLPSDPHIASFAHLTSFWILRSLRSVQSP